MKLGTSIFDEGFVFTLNKPKNYGYQPVAGLMAQTSGPCVLVECDPSNDPCQTPGQECYSDPDMCGCQCGTCDKPYCDCNDPSGVPTSGYFEDYLLNPGGYNFGDVEGQCYAPGVSALDGTASAACSCKNCPTILGNPDPNADPLVCCQDKNSTHSCVDSNGVKCPATSANGNLEGGHIWKPYTDTRTLPGGGLGPVTCYRCGCPTGYTSKKPTKYYCTIGSNPECKEDPDGPYANFKACDDAIKAGQCAERWKCKAAPDSGCEQTTDWKAKFKTQGECDSSGDCAQKYYYCKWNRYGYKFECKETKNKQWKTPFTDDVYATWYDTETECNKAITDGTGHCATGYACRQGINTGLPSQCRKAPSSPVNGQDAAGAGSPVWATESECKTACCSGSNYDEALGRCVWYKSNVRHCEILSRSECAKKPKECFMSFGTCPPEFTCGDFSDLDCGNKWGGLTCSNTCGQNSYTSYEYLQGGLFASEYIKCTCKPKPPQNPTYEY